MCAVSAPKQDRAERGIRMGSKNRAQRRADKKAAPRWQKRFTTEERINAMCKNGITPMDVDNAYQQGHTAGYNEAVDKLSDRIMKTCYAAFLLAAHEEFGFGHDRGMRLLHMADRHVIDTFASNEAIEEVFEKLKIRIQFYEPERITEALEG